MIRFLRVDGVVTIILLTSILPSFVFAQDINDPTAQSNIHASSIANNFASGFIPGVNNYDPNTKTNYYLIGPISREYRKEKSANLTTAIAANKDELIPVVPNVTALAPINKINPLQQVMNINNTTIITTNIYNFYPFTINDTRQLSSENKNFSAKLPTKGASSASPVLEDGGNDAPLPDQPHPVNINSQNGPTINTATITANAEKILQANSNALQTSKNSTR